MKSNESMLDGILKQAAAFTEEVDKLKKGYRDVQDDKSSLDKKMNTLQDSIFTLINSLQIFQKDVISKMSDLQMQVNTLKDEQGKTSSELESTKQKLKNTEMK